MRCTPLGNGFGKFWYRSVTGGTRGSRITKLEMLNNDVIRCTHGAAVGPVDPEMLFYLQSRSMDQATAEQLIVEGFFRSVLDKLAQQPIQDALWAAIAA